MKFNYLFVFFNLNQPRLIIDSYSWFKKILGFEKLDVEK
jgi:hypothetical protein